VGEEESVSKGAGWTLELEDGCGKGLQKRPEGPGGGGQFVKMDSV